MTFKTVGRCAWDVDGHLYSVDWSIGEEKWTARYTNLECEGLGLFDSIESAEAACHKHSVNRKPSDADEAGWLELETP